MIGTVTRPAGELLKLLGCAADDPRPLPVTLVLAAHPDDEVIGLGGRLPRLRDASFVHVTNGAPSDGRDAAANGFAGLEEYAQARRRELESALALASIDPRQARNLGIPDQAASLQLVELTHELVDLLTELEPEMVITHPYEGGHPDHDATAFAAHAACRLRRDRGDPVPELIEMTSYHMGPKGIEPYVFLPAGPGRGCEEVRFFLSDSQREFKRRLLACYVTQQGTLQYFSPAGVERFRVAPRYDFISPPHEGKLFFEMFSWGMTGNCFRSLAREALNALGITGPI